MSDIATDMPVSRGPRPIPQKLALRGSYHAVYIQYAPVLLCAIMVGSYYLDVYFVKLYFREIAIVLTLLLLGFNMVFAPTSITKNIVIAVLPTFAILIAMYVYGRQFHAHTGAPLFPSFIASRFWLYYLVAPNVYYAYKLGVSLRQLSNALIWSLVLLIIFGFLADTTIPLAQLAASGDKDNIVRYDSWRGFRLVLPQYALTLAFLTSFALLIERPLRLSWWRIAYFLFAAFLWASTLSRALNAALITAAITYYLTLRGSIERVIVFRVLFLMACSVGIVTLVLMADYLFQISRYDLSFMTRERTLQICLDEAKKYFTLGFGVPSNTTITLQQIYYKQFYPSDVGMAGIWFEHGIVGVLIYVCFMVAAFKSAFLLRNGMGDIASKPVVLSYVVWAMTMLVASTSAPAFIILDGVSVTGYLLGFVLIMRDRQQAGLVAR